MRTLLAAVWWGWEEMEVGFFNDGFRISAHAARVSFTVAMRTWARPQADTVNAFISLSFFLCFPIEAFVGMPS